MIITLLVLKSENEMGDSKGREKHLEETRIKWKGRNIWTNMRSIKMHKQEEITGNNRV